MGVRRASGVSGFMGGRSLLESSAAVIKKASQSVKYHTSI